MAYPDVVLCRQRELTGDVPVRLEEPGVLPPIVGVMSLPEDELAKSNELTRRSFLLSGAVASAAALPLVGRGGEASRADAAVEPSGRVRLSPVACVREGHAGSAESIREYMSGNICRCAAYPNIVAAIQQAKEQMQGA